MSEDNFVLYEEEIEKVEAIISKLVKGAEAKCALLVDKDGHLITRQGFTNTLDTTALAALLAGSFASTREIARLVGEPEFSVLFHQGKKDHIHISIVGERSILVVIFDAKSSLGLVRLRVRKATEQLDQIFEALNRKPEDPAAESPFAEITDDDIDNLFND